MESSSKSSWGGLWAVGLAQRLVVGEEARKLGRAVLQGRGRAQGKGQGRGQGRAARATCRFRTWWRAGDRGQRKDG